MQTQPDKKPAQARFMYLYGGIAPMITSLITPCTLYLGLRKTPHLSDVQRSKELFMEASRQFLSAATGVIFYFTGGELARLWQKHQGSSKSEASTQMQKFVSGLIVSFIGYAFVRPVVQAKFINHVSGREPIAVVKPIEKLLQAIEKTPGGGKPFLFVSGISLLALLAKVCHTVAHRVTATKPQAATPQTTTLPTPVLNQARPVLNPMTAAARSVTLSHPPNLNTISSPLPSRPFQVPAAFPAITAPASRASYPAAGFSYPVSPALARPISPVHI